MSDDLVKRLREFPLFHKAPSETRWIRSALNEPICRDAADEIERLRAENADLGRDANRYRWLNGSESEWEPFDSAWLHSVDLYGQGPKEMDEFIDKAISEQALQRVSGLGQEQGL